MKLLKHLLAVMAIIGLSTSVVAQRVAKPELPDRPEKPVVDKGPFGAWLDKEGFIIPGPKIKNWIDTDRDRIDDRMQKGPGTPVGEQRPEIFIPKPEPRPKPGKPGEGGEKPETGGPDPKPEPRPFPPKPGKPGEGGGKPKPRPKPPQPKKPTLGGNSDDKAEGKPERPERPQRPARPELSDDVKSKLDAYKKESGDLRKALKDQLKALKNPTRDQIKKISKDFQEVQKARIDAQKELSSQIKDGLKAARPERPAKPVVPDAVHDLRKQHDETLKQVSEAKKALMQKLSAGKLSREDHKALLDGFREGQKKLQEDMKSIQRQIREAIEKPTGDAADAKERVDRRPPPRPKPAPKTDDRRPTGR